MLLLLAGEERTKPLLRSHQSSWSWVWVTDVSWGKNSALKKCVSLKDCHLHTCSFIMDRGWWMCNRNYVSIIRPLPPWKSAHWNINSCWIFHWRITTCNENVICLLSLQSRLTNLGWWSPHHANGPKNWQKCQFLLCLTFNTHIGKYFCTASHTEHIHII
jgi:hypothetical protein